MVQNFVSENVLTKGGLGVGGGCVGLSASMKKKDNSFSQMRIEEELLSPNLNIHLSD